MRKKDMMAGKIPPKPKFTYDWIVLLIGFGYLLSIISTFIYLFEASADNGTKGSTIVLVVSLVLKILIFYRITFLPIPPKRVIRIFIMSSIIVAITLSEIFYAHAFKLDILIKPTTSELGVSIGMWLQFTGTLILFIGSFIFMIRGIIRIKKNPALMKSENINAPYSKSEKEMEEESQDNS